MVRAFISVSALVVRNGGEMADGIWGQNFGLAHLNRGFDLFAFGRGGLYS